MNLEKLDKLEKKIKKLQVEIMNVIPQEERDAMEKWDDEEKKFWEAVSISLKSKVKQFFSVLSFRDTVFINQNKKISIGNGETATPKSILPMAKQIIQEVYKAGRTDRKNLVKKSQ